MSTNCDKCGYRDNEIKSGGAISEKGKRITVKVEDREDLSRDILKVSLQQFPLTRCYDPNNKKSERNSRTHYSRNRPGFITWYTWRSFYDT